MVRPLIEVQSDTELATLLGNQPVVGDAKELCTALNGYAVVLRLIDNRMSAYVMICSKTGTDYYVAVTDNVDIITPVVDLPCSTDVISGGSIFGELEGLVRNIAQKGGYNFGSLIISERENYSDISLTCKRI